jgi:hypothetical protein
MRLKCFLIPMMLVISISASSQTLRQKNLLVDFFEHSGKNIIAGWAHPTHKFYPSKTQVFASGYCTTVKIFFNGTLLNYSCTYKVCYDTYKNKFSSIDILLEGNLLKKSFQTCEDTKMFSACINACKAALNLHWITEGFKRSF